MDLMDLMDLMVGVLDYRKLSLTLETQVSYFQILNLIYGVEHLERNYICYIKGMILEKTH